MIKSFGIVTVTGAGTPVRATDNETDPTLRQGCQGFRIQAHPDNTNLIYVFAGMTTPPADHRTDGVGLVAILLAPSDPLTGPFAAVEYQMPNVPAGFNLNDIWIDAGANDQAAIVSAVV